MYVNGALERTTATTAAIGDTTQTLQFGGSSWSTTYMSGVLDEVAIYTTALTQTRIQAHYDAGKP
jgi:hypothetical protein